MLERKKLLRGDPSDDENQYHMTMLLEENFVMFRFDSYHLMIRINGFEEFEK